MFKKIVCLYLCLLITGCSSHLFSSAKENPAAAEINAKLALAYLEKNDLVHARQKLIAAQQQAPHDPAIWYSSGYFFERTGDNSAARHAYLRAIQLSPQEGAAQNNYGVFLCRQGEYAAAISHFLLAAKDPSYLNVANAYQNAAYCAAKIPDKALADGYTRLAKARAGKGAKGSVINSPP